MSKINKRRLATLLISVVVGVFLSSLVACARPQVVKPDVRRNAERAHNELTKEEKR